MKKLMILVLLVSSVGCASTHKSMRITIEKDLFDNNNTKIKAEFRVGNVTFFANSKI